MRLQAENVALRQQLLVLNRKAPTRVRLRNVDRLVLVWLYRILSSILDAIVIVKPERCSAATNGASSLLALEISTP